MNNWYIYKITNLLNGKSYVGQRKRQNSITDKYMGSGIYLHRAFKKYGIENFKKEILKDGIHCQTAANIFEQIYIKKENTMIPNGYNLNIGGNVYFPLSPNHRESIIESNKKRKCSEETIEKQRKSHINQIPWNKNKRGCQISNRKGKSLSFEHKEKLKLAWIKRKENARR